MKPKHLVAMLLEDSDLVDEKRRRLAELDKEYDRSDNNDFRQREIVKEMELIRKELAELEPAPVKAPLSLSDQMRDAVNCSDAVQSHIQGDTAWIDMIEIPEDKRRSGLGRRYFVAWERSLPDHVSTIRLMAADAGAGPSDDFWLKLGFKWVNNGEGWDRLDYKDQKMMVKARSRS